MLPLEVKAIRETIHELFLKYNIKQEAVREIVEFKQGEVIIATFEYEDKQIKIIAKIRESEITVFEKIINNKYKFMKTLETADELLSNLKKAWS